MKQLRWGNFFLISPGIVALFLAMFFGVELFLAFSIGRLVAHESWSLVKGLAHSMQGPMLLGAMTAYGGWRALRFHPAVNKPYQTWLMSTPWTAAMPLPLGPITLVWQDALLLALTAPLAIHSGVHFQDPVLAICCGYGAGAGWALAITQQYRSVYTILLASAGVVRWYHDPALVIAIALTLAAFAAVSLRRSLRDFPWKANKPFISSDRPAAPFDRLGPPRAFPKFSAVQAMMIGLLAGTWSYISMFTTAESEQTSSLHFSIFVAGSLMTGIRLLAYMIDGYLPPVSLLGRISTGRIIIPGFDQILVAPACIALIFWAVPPVLLQLHWTPPTVIGVTMGIATTAMLGLGPSLDKWRLTGSHRIVPKQKINEQPRIRTSR